MMLPIPVYSTVTPPDGVPSVQWELGYAVVDALSDTDSESSGLPRPPESSSMEYSIVPILIS